MRRFHPMHVAVALPQQSRPNSRLRKMLLEGEHQQQDFKQTISSSQKIAKTLSAFANTDGGRLMVGVRDNGTVKGSAPEEERHMLESAANFFVKPALNLTYIEQEYEGKTVLVVLVPKSDDKPHYALGDDGKWWAYVRVKDHSLLASPTSIEVMKREAAGIETKIEFGSKEKGLLEYLAANERITIKEFCRLVNISRWRAGKILVNLISAGVIRSHVTEKTEFYTAA